MRNNIIAIVAISFATVGALWGIGNLLNPPEESGTKVEGILLIAQRNTFNSTNPDIHVTIGVPTRLVVHNEDAVQHDLVVDKAENDGITPFNTAIIPGGLNSPTMAIVTEKPGTYEYYCSLHPQMRGKIIAQ
jgi:plastocyanin